MKITKVLGKLVIQATSEELRKNPKLAAAIKKEQDKFRVPVRKAQGVGGVSVDPAAHGGGMGGDIGGAGLPTGGADLGGPSDGVSDELGGVDPMTDGVDGDLAGDPTEKFTSSVEKAYHDAFGKPIDEGMKQVLRGLAQMAQGDKSPAVDDLDSTNGQVPGGDLGDSPDDMGGDPAAQGAGAGGMTGGSADPMGGAGPLAAMSRGRLTKVASADDFVRRLAAKLIK